MSGPNGFMRMKRLATRIASALIGRRGEASIRLRAEGASREVLRHVDEHGDILAAWDTCPRGTWCVEIIALGGMRSALVAQALYKLCDEYADVALRSVADQYAAGALESAGLVDGVVVRAGAIIDGMKDVAAVTTAASDAQLRGEHDEVRRLALLHDDVYAEHHLQMARVVRAVVSRDEVRSAFGVARSGPYR